MKSSFIFFACLFCAATSCGQPVATGDLLIASSSWPLDRNTLVIGQWRVSLDRLQKQPIWDPLKEDSPPLSASAASKITIAKIQEDFPDIKQWEVSQVVLRNIYKGEGEHSGPPSKDAFPNRWYYFVFAKPVSQTEAVPLESQRARLCAVILMDGSVVIPEFSDAVGLWPRSN